MDEDVRAVERWFLARGTPHLIEGYTASEDVFTRALPALTLVFVAEVAAVVNTDWTWWQNVLAGVGGLALLLGIWVGVNLARGHRALARPARVGPVEIAVFVVGPGLVPLLVGGWQVRQAVMISVSNLALLAVIYAVTSYGLVPMTRWALGRTVRQLEAVVHLVGRALPLLLLINIVLFLNAEVWEVGAGFDGPYLATVVGLFVLLGLVFLLTRLPRELGRLAEFDSVEEVRAACAGTPGERLCGHVVDPPPRQPLTRRQRGNVLLVTLFSQGVQIVLMTVVVFAFFVALGLLTITPDVLTRWVGHEGEPHATFWLLGRQAQLTDELVKVSLFLASFSGLYFTVVLVTDATYRAEFLEEILDELRQTFAVRAAYLAVLGRTRPPSVRTW